MGTPPSSGWTLQVVDEPDRRPIELSLRWYLFSLLAALVPLAATWLVAWGVEGHLLSPWALIGHGELALVSIPVLILAILSLIGCQHGKRTAATLVITLIGVLLTTLGGFMVFTLDDLERHNADLIRFVLFCACIFFLSAALGGYSVWHADRGRSGGYK